MHLHVVAPVAVPIDGDGRKLEGFVRCGRRRSHDEHLGSFARRREHDEAPHGRALDDGAFTLGARVERHRVRPRTGKRRDELARGSRRNEAGQRRQAPCVRAPGKKPRFARKGRARIGFGYDPDHRVAGAVVVEIGRETLFEHEALGRLELAPSEQPAFRCARREHGLFDGTSGVARDRGSGRRGVRGRAAVRERAFDAERRVRPVVAAAAPGKREGERNDGTNGCDACPTSERLIGIIRLRTSADASREMPRCLRARPWSQRPRRMPAFRARARRRGKPPSRAG